MSDIEQGQKGNAPWWRRLFKGKDKGGDSGDPQTIEIVGLTSGARRFENSDPRRIINWGLFILLLFFGGGGAWATLAKVSGAVVFQGLVKVEAERKTVQHLGGGIIKEILVKDGDKVKKDQPLVILESSAICSSADQIQAQIYGQTATAARLEAEKDMAKAVTFPDSLKNREGGYLNADVAAAVEAETKIFNSRRKAMQGQEDLIRNQIEQVGEQNASIEERIKAEEIIIDAISEELTAKEALFKDRFIDKSVILQLKRTQAEHEGLRGQFKGSLAENREKIASLQLQIASLHDRYVEEASTKLAQTGAQLLGLRDQLRPLNDARTRLVISAPISGEVVTLKVHTVGGVLGAGQPILDIVPENSQLVIEGKITLRDITKVAVGQKADVQLLAFETRTKPKIPGTVRYISADRIIEQQAAGLQEFYKVEIDLDKEAIAKAGLYLSPGMPAAVYILTKARTVFDYIMEPLMINFEMALREN